MKLRTGQYKHILHHYYHVESSYDESHYLLLNSINFLYFFPPTVDILTDNIKKESSIKFKCSCKSIYQDSDIKAAKWNSAIFDLFIPDAFLLWRVKMSTVKKKAWILSP